MSRSALPLALKTAQAQVKLSGPGGTSLPYSPIRAPPFTGIRVVKLYTVPLGGTGARCSNALNPSNVTRLPLTSFPNTASCRIWSGPPVEKSGRSTR